MFSLAKVKVFDDMGHLNYTPSELPEYVVKQIQQDTKATYPKINGMEITSYVKVDGVPTIRQILGYSIDYSKLETKKSKDKKQSYKQNYKKAIVPKGNVIKGEHFLTIIDNLLSHQECKDLIKRAYTIKNEGYNKAWHPADTGGIYMRVLMLDRKLADMLWNRILPFLPKTYNGYRLCYLNDHFRFSRYKNGGKFHVHCDGKNYDASRPELCDGYSAESLFTLNINLNEGFKGGETDFFETNKNKDLDLRVSLIPKTGRAGLFWHDQYHRGNVVYGTDEAEFKYLLRTDVMGIRE